MNRFENDIAKITLPLYTKNDQENYIYGKINLNRDTELNLWQWNVFNKFLSDLDNAYCGVKYRTTDSLNGREPIVPLEEFAQKMQALYDTEHEVSDIYKNKPQTINKDKHLSALINAGARAWVMYKNLLNANTHHMNGIDLLTHLEEDRQSAISNGDYQLVYGNQNGKEELKSVKYKDINIALQFYSRHKKAENYVETHYGNFFDDTFGFMFNGYKKPSAIYRTIDAVDILQQVVAEYGGYDYRKHQHEMDMVKESVTTDAHKNVLKFYDDYADIKYTIKFLKRVANNSQPNNILIFDDTDFKTGKSRDMYKTALEYLEFTQKLVDAKVGDISDFEYVSKTLSYYLEKLKSTYEQYQQEIQSALKRFPRPSGHESEK